MKGLVPVHDPPSTKEGMQVVRTATPEAVLADNGVGVVVPRHDPWANREIAFPDVVSERVALNIPKSGATQFDKINPEDFTEVGKPPLHATSHAQIWTSTDIPSKLAYDGWPPEDGYFAKWIRSNIVRAPRGFQTAIIDPVNITVPQSVPAGSQAALPGASVINLSDLYVQ